MAEPKAEKAPAPIPEVEAPALSPIAIKLHHDYAWFVEGAFRHRAAGTVVTDADEIAALLAMNAKYSEEAA